MVYMIARIALLLHQIQLSVGAIIVYADPSVAGLRTFVPLGALLFYEATNWFLIALTVVAFRLMFRRRREAIAANITLNALFASSLVAWHFLGMKSSAGTVIDALPALVGIWYFLASRRVRNTFTGRGD